LEEAHEKDLNSGAQAAMPDGYKRDSGNWRADRYYKTGNVQRKDPDVKPTSGAPSLVPNAKSRARIINFFVYDKTVCGDAIVIVARSRCEYDKAGHIAFVQPSRCYFLAG
jgi:hypothetical protein